jgi:hypothetical protein
MSNAAKPVAVFTFLAYSGPDGRQGAQESACGKIRGYTVRPDGSVETGRWQRAGNPSGLTLAERGAAV